MIDFSTGTVTDKNGGRKSGFYDAIGTKHLGPCISFLTFTGDQATCSHINPESCSLDDIESYLTWFKKNVPKGSQILMVGGMSGHSSLSRKWTAFSGSEECGSFFIDAFLSMGYSVREVDTFGDRNRNVTITKSGKLSVKDNWDPHHSIELEVQKPKMKKTRKPISLANNNDKIKPMKRSSDLAVE